MKDYKLDVQVKIPFANLKYRDRHVLILVRDGNGKYLLGGKNEYPLGLVRMLGGGVDKDENVRIAAMRELVEELNVQVTDQDLAEIARIDTHAVDEDGHEYSLMTYLYYFQLTDEEYSAGDDVSDIVALDLEDLSKLADKYESIPADLKSEDEGFYWEDYGKVYGPIHRIAYNEAKKIMM